MLFVEFSNTLANSFTLLVTRSKQLFKSRGFLSSTEAKVNFGLGSISKIDSIVIVWPNLMHQKIENLQANQLLKIDYNSELAVLKNKKVEKPLTFFSEEKLISYKHEEDTYNDFFNERLIPYKISTLGPIASLLFS